MAIVVIGSLWKFDTADDVSKVLLAVTGVVGTVVGAFFGVQAGAAGIDQANKTAKEAQKKADTHANDARDKAMKAAEAETRGRSLAAAIRARGGSRGGGGQGFAAAPERVQDDLSALADELFPP